MNTLKYKMAIITYFSCQSPWQSRLVEKNVIIEQKKNLKGEKKDGYKCYKFPL